MNCDVSRPSDRSNRYLYSLKQAKHTCGSCHETESSQQLRQSARPRRGRRHCRQTDLQPNDKKAMGRMAAAFEIFRGAVFRPEGAGTNQPGAERSAASGGDDKWSRSPKRATQTEAWLVSPFQGRGDASETIVRFLPRNKAEIRGAGMRERNGDGSSLRLLFANQPPLSTIVKRWDICGRDIERERFYSPATVISNGE